MSDRDKTLSDRDKTLSDRDKTRKLMLKALSATFDRMLYADREEDEDLPPGAIQQGIVDRVVPLDSYVRLFRECLEISIRRFKPSRSAAEIALRTLGGMEWWQTHDMAFDDPQWGRVCMRCDSAVPSGHGDAHQHCMNKNNNSAG